MKRLVIAATLLFAASTSFAIAETPTLIEQGNKLWSEQKIDQAEKVFQQAIKESPDSATAYERLAGLYLTHDKISKSIPMYQQAITLQPDNARLFVGLSLAYLHQQEYAKSNAMAMQARVLNPNLPQADKLMQYISKKQEVIAMAAKAEQADTQGMPTGHRATDGPVVVAPVLKTAPALHVAPTAHSLPAVHGSLESVK